jgi:O-antigen/teichoic acid export membrane protein
MNPLQRLAGMTATFVVSDAARGAIGFATSLVLARGLGLEGFGAWTIVMAWAALATLAFDLGFGVLLTREAGRGTPTGAMVGAALGVRLGAFCPIAVTMAAAAPLLAGPAGVESVSAFRLAPVLAAVGLAYGSVAPAFRASPGRLMAILSLESVEPSSWCAGRTPSWRSCGSPSLSGVCSSRPRS